MEINKREGVNSDKSWIFELYRTTLKTHIDTTWGWDEAYQQEIFDTKLHPSNFIVVSSETMTLGAYMPVYQADHIWLEMILYPKRYEFRCNNHLKNNAIFSKLAIYERISFNQRRSQ